MVFPAPWQLVTRAYPVYPAVELIFAFCAPLWLGLNCGSVDDFLSMVSMVLVPWEVDTMLGMGMEFKGKIMQHCFWEV